MLRRLHLPAVLDNLRASYWFVPALMTAGAILLAFMTHGIDQLFDERGIFRDMPYLYSPSPEGARTTLSQIAGSMIGVAGVTFSMTLVSVSFAAGQFGPRLVGNVMRDRGNQFTLGTFVATFVYCLLTLRTVRNAETGEVAEGLERVGAFVPHFSMLVALALALMSVVVLIYFIHHVAESLDVNRMAASIGRDLRDLLLEPPLELDDESLVPIDANALGPLDFPWVIESERDGFVGAVDVDALATTAREHNVVISLSARPGDFVVSGDELLRVRGDLRGDARESFRRTAEACVSIGSSRSGYQDPLFLADELVEILARALSPGVNDPFTAVAVIEWSTVALCAFGRHGPVRRYGVCDGDSPRVVVDGLSFETVATRLFGQMAQYASTDRIVSRKMRAALRRVLEAAPHERAALEYLRSNFDAMCAREEGENSHSPAMTSPRRALRLADELEP